ncbi:MAG: hypothetical protein Q4A65_08165 [Bacillota bacterium]|nr:hypothetical protein [Bacillota bacterium]
MGNTTDKEMSEDLKAIIDKTQEQSDSHPRETDRLEICKDEFMDYYTGDASEDGVVSLEKSQYNNIKEDWKMDEYTKELLEEEEITLEIADVDLVLEATD